MTFREFVEAFWDYYGPVGTFLLTLGVLATIVAGVLAATHG